MNDRIKQRIVYYIQTRGPSSCEDWERDLKISHQSASAALTTLTKEGVVTDVGMRKRTKAGRSGRIVDLVARIGKKKMGFF